MSTSRTLTFIENSHIMSALDLDLEKIFQVSQFLNLIPFFIDSFVDNKNYKY
jgi:hypothetical protein